jgi:steroid delta-isomerase-like uncharacterized protein
MSVDLTGTNQGGKAITLRCFTELWARRRLDVADEILSVGYLGHAPGARDMQGRDALKDLVSRYHEGFPGLKVTVLGQLAEDDRVVTEFTLSGVHTGRWFGVPSTGRSMTLGGLAFSRISGGLIAEQWYEWERRKLLEQLDLLPVLPG